MRRRRFAAAALDVEDLVDLAGAAPRQPAPDPRHGPARFGGGPAQTTVSGEDAYPDISTKAAALLWSMVNNHPLIDGDKRLGWPSTAVFLELKGVATQHATKDDVYESVVGIAAGARTIEAIAEGLRVLVRADLAGRHAALGSRSSARCEKSTPRAAATSQMRARLAAR